MVVYRGRIIVMGGEEEKRVQSFLFEQDTWKDYDPMIVGRRWAGARLVKGQIFVIGGVQGQYGPVAHVEVFDLNTKKWSLKSAQQYPCNWPILADDGHFIYCISQSGTVERYDVMKDTWTQLGVMPDELGSPAGCCAVCAGGMLYVVGGHSRVATSFDLNTGKWKPIKQPLYPHAFGSALLSQGEILLFGGEGTTQIEKYQMRSDLWSECHLKMPCEMDHHSVTVITP